jgi:hypothetical protein
MHNMSLVGVKGHSGAIELYQLKDPEVVFTKINPEEFNNLRLVLTAHKTFHHNLNQFFHLEDQNATAAKQEKFNPGNKNKEDTKSDTELDVDTSIPDFNKHKGHKKENNSHLYIAFVLIIGAGLLYYYFTKRRPELPQRVAYEMTGARETKAQVIDNSMFDKAE